MIFCTDFPNLTTTQIRTALGNFLFTGEDVFKKIKFLSGGEKGRLQLCKILKKGPNLLLLDEPTNHMDIVGKESLENILKEYKGTLIFVSHDRYFVNKIADALLIFEKDKVTYFNGTYEEYLNKKEEMLYEERDNKLQEKVTVQNKEADNKTNNSYFINKEINKMKNKINKLENEIKEREDKIKALEAEMYKEENCANYLKLKEIEDEIQKINKEIEEKMQEWEELSNKI